MNENDFKKSATEYLWGDYCNAESEYQEVELLAARLESAYAAGLRRAAEIARENAEGHLTLAKHTGEPHFNGWAAVAETVERAILKEAGEKQG